MSKKPTTLAHLAKPKPEAKDKRNGVEKILAYLNENKNDIGALVVGIAPKAGKRIKSRDGGRCDGRTLTADLVSATNADERASDTIRTYLVQGIANTIAQRVLPGHRGLFG